MTKAEFLKARSAAFAPDEPAAPNFDALDDHLDFAREQRGVDKLDLVPFLHHVFAEMSEQERSTAMEIMGRYFLMRIG